ncbi:hypothetical protein PR048_024878 [Dryococelus australis]|uniref:Uncharacterized protein n=1 Tax=Dryococelus australis TaxID=614101 RepID=A0ABQ9GPT5_9NEOP|nr:hypothetical protein PR048_024878 [Dryococelus australis]
MHDNCDCSWEGDIGDKILCLSISPTGQLFSVGTAAVRRAAPLHLYDLQTRTRLATLPREWKKGAGTLDLTWMNDNILLAGSYDTSIRMWDVR